ncbi:MAG: hypothetical protein JNL58_02475 [Planctomyces sp.]|nr:hypothetical protein [Planctomyces sp.]
MRLQLPLVMVISCLTALCVITAVFLFQQQSEITDILKENVNSRRASVDLEECLVDITVLLKDHVDDVSALHNRLEQHLFRLAEVADQPMEKELSQRLEQAFVAYQRTWNTLRTGNPDVDEQQLQRSIRFLESEMIAPCREFRLYNGRLIEETTNNHERILGELAWGMAGMGAMSAVAGIFVGYGLTRGLTQSIRRLQVQIRDVTGKLGGEDTSVIVTEEGQFSGLRADLHQLTERIEGVLKDLKQKELEVLRSEQLAAVGHLAAGVAHEIRNPLTSIKMLIQAGLEDEQAGGRIPREDLVVIESEIRRMESSLKMFLDFTRPPQLQRSSVDLRSLLQDATGLVRGKAARQHVTINIITSDDPLELTVDREQIRQVLVNLLLNGIDAQPHGGSIQLELRRTSPGAELIVTDRGPGIAPNMMPRMFQPFATNKETGLGLGLVISRRIMEDHGGSLTVENRPEGGAQFRLSIPSS